MCWNWTFHSEIITNYDNIKCFKLPNMADNSGTFYAIGLLYVNSTYQLVGKRE